MTYYLQGPFFDSFALTEYLYTIYLPEWPWVSGLGFADNEHRPLFPMLVWALDATLFRFDGLLSIIVLLATLAACGLCFLLAGWMVKIPRDPVPWAAFGLAILILFWPGHHENLLWPKQVHMTMSLAASLAGLLLLIRFDRIQSTQIDTPAVGRLPIWAAVLFFVASFSFAYGLVAWLTAIIFGIWRQWPRTTVMFLLAIFIFTLAIYFNPWRPPGRITYSTGNTFDPFVIVPFAWGLIGAPLRMIVLIFGITDDLLVAFVFGAVGFLGLVAIAVHAHRSGLRHATQDPLTLFSLAVLLFAVGALSMIALGRGDGGWEEIGAPRYLLVSNVLWIAMIVYVLRTIERLKPRRPHMVGLLAYGAMILVATTYWGFGNILKSESQRIHLGMILPVVFTKHTPAVDLSDDTYLHHRIASNFKTQIRVFGLMRSQGVGPYSRAWPKWPGRTLSDAFKTTTRVKCRGSIDHLRPYWRTGAHVVGWAWDPERRQAVDHVVLVDKAGIIQGVGHGGNRRPDVANDGRVEGDQHTGWTAFARVPPANIVTVYGVIDDQLACRLDRS